MALLLSLAAPLLMAAHSAAFASSFESVASRSETHAGGWLTALHDVKEATFGMGSVLDCNPCTVKSKPKNKTTLFSYG